MTSYPQIAKVVRVRTERGEGGLFYATSSDLKGLLVAEPTLDDLEAAIPVAIAELYDACGEDVIVTRVDEAFDDTRGWVAMPAALASSLLAKKAVCDASR